MNAIIPERTIEVAQSWVLYDGECSLCTGAARRFAPMLLRYHFNLAPLQTRWAQECLDIKSGEPLTEMKLLAEDGQVYGGADALVQIGRCIWWTWPLFPLTQIPGAMILLRAIYRRMAANRQCLNGKCELKPRTRHHGVTTFFEMP